VTSRHCPNGTNTSVVAIIKQVEEAQLALVTHTTAVITVTAVQAKVIASMCTLVLAAATVIDKPLQQ
jgi:hypothetical protein